MRLFLTAALAAALSSCPSAAPAQAPEREPPAAPATRTLPCAPAEAVLARLAAEGWAVLTEANDGEGNALSLWEGPEGAWTAWVRPARSPGWMCLINAGRAEAAAGRPI